jgi:hypothetical protein
MPLNSGCAFVQRPPALKNTTSAARKPIVAHDREGGVRQVQFRQALVAGRTLAVADLDVDLVALRDLFSTIEFPVNEKQGIALFWRLRRATSIECSVVLILLP